VEALAENESEAVQHRVQAQKLLSAQREASMYKEQWQEEVDAMASMMSGDSRGKRRSSIFRAETGSMSAADLLAKSHALETELRHEQAQVRMRDDGANQLNAEIASYEATITSSNFKISSMEQAKRQADQQLRSEMQALASLRDELSTVQSDLDIQVSSNAVLDQDRENWKGESELLMQKQREIQGKVTEEKMHSYMLEVALQDQEHEVAAWELSSEQASRKIAAIDEKLSQAREEEQLVADKFDESISSTRERSKESRKLQDKLELLEETS
jgi:chromosome segregation ATPase